MGKKAYVLVGDQWESIGGGSSEESLTADEIIGGANITIDKASIPGSVVIHGLTGEDIDEIVVGPTPPVTPFPGQVWIELAIN